METGEAAANGDASGSLWFRVVWKPRVALRAKPERSAQVLASLSVGDVIEVAEIVDGWARLSQAELRKRCSTHPEPEAAAEGWALLDGTSLGLGELLRACNSEGGVPLKLQVSTSVISSGGEVCEVAASSLWTGREVKAAVKAAAGIGVHEQRLFVGTAPRSVMWKNQHISYVEVHNGTRLNTVLDGSPHAQLLLAQRSSEQAFWLEKLEAAGSEVGAKLASAPPHIRADHEAVLVAVRQCGMALEHAGVDLLASKELVLAAVMQDGMALQFALDELRADREVALAAVASRGAALQYASPALQADSAVVLAALRSDASSLQFCSPKLKEDRTLLLAAMEQASVTLEHASALWRDKVWNGESRGTAAQPKLTESPTSRTGNDEPKPAAASRTAAQEYTRVRAVQSVEHGHPMQKLPTTELGRDKSGGGQAPSVFVSPGTIVGKPWLGFGGSFTEAAAVTLQKMSKAKQDEVMKAYFDHESGLGYNLGRVHIGSCDFCLNSWTCGNLASGDMSLRGFSLERYQTAILPMIRKAAQIAGEPITMMASPWSPPPWMKTSREFVGEGRLRSTCRDAWALHYVKFVEEMGRAGVPIWAISVQNEPEAGQPWESCIYTAEEERDFVRDYLGPAMEAAGLGAVKIIVWDHNRDGMLERAATVYSDEKAAKYIWGVGYHWYGDVRFEQWPDRCTVPFEDHQDNGRKIYELRGQAGFENVRKVAELRPDKHIIFTEGTQELGGRSLQSLMGDWKTAERYASNIITDVNNGCEGWIDWNLVLDQTGGPNHTGNFCTAVVICDTKEDAVLYQPSFWYLAHFARYFRPGDQRVLSGTSREALEVVAYLTANKSLVVVVLNQSDMHVEFWLKVAGAGAVPTVAPAHSITTYIVDDGKSAEAK